MIELLRAAVAVDGTNNRLRAALSVDGGIRSGGRVYAGDAAGRYNAAVSHRIDGSDCLLRLSEDGVTGYVARPGDSETNRAVLGVGFYKMKIAAGDAPIGTIQAGGSTWDLPVDEEGIGTVEAGVIAWDLPGDSKTKYEGLGTIRAVIEIV